MSIRRILLLYGLFLLLLVVIVFFRDATQSWFWLSLAVLGFLPVAYWFEGWIIRPIRQLTQLLYKLRVNDGEARMLSVNDNEVGQFVRAFNQYHESSRSELSSLNRSRARLNIVFEHIIDGVLIVNLRGLVVSINPAAEVMLEQEADAAIDQTLASVVRHHDIIELWQRGQASGDVQQSVVELGSAGQVWQVEVAPILMGDVRGSIVILHDLTPVRRLETVRQDFISNISHELRTPLASLRAVVETLQDGALDDPPAAKRFLRRADDEIDTLTQMVEELLELSRIESGRVPFHFSPTPVEDVIHLAVERLTPQAKRAMLSIVTDVRPNLPPTLADADRIQQVMVNLLYNAIKFTPQDGTVTISADTFESESGQPMVVVTVSDNGIGIAPDDLPRIFERFYKADRARTRSHGGTGLGLSIAKHIVQSHDGAIWAESGLGQGSTFYFTLPVAT